MIQAKFEGGRISGRVELWPDEYLSGEGYWTINGRNDTDAAQGNPGDMVRLALTILQNIPDDR